MEFSAPNGRFYYARCELAGKGAGMLSQQASPTTMLYTMQLCALASYDSLLLARAELTRWRGGRHQGSNPVTAEATIESWKLASLMCGSN